MATVSAASTTDAYATMGGVRYQLCITTRISDDAPASLKSEQLQGMVAHTIATWQRAMQAVLTGTWAIAEFNGKVWPSAEEKQGVTVRDNHEPYVTVWNKGGAPINLTVQSWDNGVYALESAKDTLAGLAKFKEHASAFGFDSFEYTALPSLKPAEAAKPAPTPPAPKPATAQAKDKDDVDAWLKNASDSQSQAPEGDGLPFRHFKQLAPNIIQVQEFVQGGGEKYQKSAIAATLPYHKSNVQYDDDSLIYYSITGEIQIKEGQYGRQAIIPTDKGKVYVDATNKAGEESPDWHNFAQDLRDEYQRLANDDNAKLFAPNCLLVMKTSKTKDNKQYKNFYHIYQPLKQAVLA